MNFYDDLVMQTQMNYSRHYPIYASGSTPYQLTDKKPLPYSEQIHRLVQEVKEADCVVVGGASGLSTAGGGDFYYEDNDSYRKYFRPFAEKYHFKGAFAGMMHPWKTREEYWGYLASFLHTTQTAPVRHSYLDLDALLKGKDFFILTTNQDTQFVKLYPEEKVAEIQGNQFSRLALGSMMIRLVCLHVQTASDLLFFSWRRSKKCNGQTERFDAISKDLKKRGMKFVGSIIIYAYLQAVGVINSHESGCFLNPLQQ